MAERSQLDRTEDPNDEVCPVEVQIPFDHLTLPEKVFKRIQQGDEQGLKQLIGENQSINFDIIDQKGFHTLHIASIAGNIDVLKTLFESGAPSINISDKIDIKDPTGLTPLHYAANEGFADCLEYLLNKGAYIDPLNEDAVCYFGGVRIPLYVTGGKSPLLFASEKGELECVNILLQRGANKNLIDFDGNQAYDLALLHRNTKLATLIKNYPESATEIEPMTEALIKTKTQHDHQLRAARISQKEKEKKRKATINRALDYYTRLHKDVYEFKDSFLDDQFLKILNSEDPSSHLKEEHERIYSMNFFTNDFCRKLIEEAENIEKSGVPVRRPNSMNHYGIVLDEVGFQTMIDQLIERCITPFAKKLFLDVGGDHIQSHHAFLVRYKIGEDLDLSTHVDDCDVTLNVCLGREGFEGGGLFFRGIRGTDNAFKDWFEYGHSIGKGLLHLGKHIHGANKLTAGERINLIIWCRTNR